VGNLHETTDRLDCALCGFLEEGLDTQALLAVASWRFKPAIKDGHPVAVIINVEVNFKLY
jgi:hypothetical protein